MYQVCKKNWFNFENLEEQKECLKQYCELALMEFYLKDESEFEISQIDCILMAYPIDKPETELEKFICQYLEKSKIYLFIIEKILENKTTFIYSDSIPHDMLMEQSYQDVCNLEALEYTCHINNKYYGGNPWEVLIKGLTETEIKEILKDICIFEGDGFECTWAKYRGFVTGNIDEIKQEITKKINEYEKLRMDKINSIQEDLLKVTLEQAILIKDILDEKKT